MNKALFLTCLLLAACGGQQNHSETPASPAPAEASAAASAPAEPKATLPLGYAAYRSAANAALKANKLGLSLPENIEPSPAPDEPGIRKAAHHYPEGLDVIAETDADGKMFNLRVIWHSDTEPKKAKQLSAAAAVLLAATAPEDRTLAKDTAYQIERAVSAHNQGRDPTTVFSRGGIAYKVTVTNLPSVVLTAQPE
ncbi:hypothetical protein [Neisseria bacilliformis]|uniref:hypothetical protein n=1 Tax=Neisseria bacilliformis TaxID=267212 RepID=UPI0028E2AD21|nr:hypothetical protein [Neisseria bacilliformis]